MAKEYLKIKGAREHNLKNIDINIPLDSFTVITGLSGSGKSSLAFDTIYAEGQRRYVESLSAYARQFLGLMNKPDVDSISGLSPAISIEQKSVSKNPRSTVGTITEIYDYLRLLYARIGQPHCPRCRQPISSQSAESIVDVVLGYPKDSKIEILAPVIRGKKGTYEQLFERLKNDGFARVRVDKKVYDLEEKIKLSRYKIHNIEVVVDRVKVDSKSKSRLQDAVETALEAAEGFALIVTPGEEKLFSRYLACVDCGINFEEIQPRLFSFNSPYGACSKCHGLGVAREFDVDLIIPNKNLSVNEGAIAPWSVNGYRGQTLEKLAAEYKIDLDQPVKNMSPKDLDLILYGADKKMRFDIKSQRTGSHWSYWGRFEGVIPQLERYLGQTESERRSEEIQKFLTDKPCPDCQGMRLKPESLAITINKKNISGLTSLSIADTHKFLESLKLTSKEQKIAKLILKEIQNRLNFLLNVGLEYLTLDRRASTLSGGEAQRIRLATQIGSELRGVLYILDEPSIGLHRRDNQKLIKTLADLRDLGNTVVVVEHDSQTILSADHLIDLGPGAGIHGGKIVAEGSPKDIIKNKNSLTGQYLSGRKKIEIPKKLRSPRDFIELVGASQHNLKNINVKFPLSVLCCVTGVSGSGKSTLVNETLYKGLAKEIGRARIIPGQYQKINKLDKVDKVIAIDQSPIGRTPRSNPATYIKVFDYVRELLSQTKEARARGYQPGRFSFNVQGGRCEHCRGDGLIKIEMHFLPDIYVECEKCKGQRYNRETLEVTYKDKNIADILNMTVEEALEFFQNIPRIEKKLKTLADVGLGYVKLGQSSTTLSGGEAQRIKLTAELSKRDTGQTVYILDEPTTGLHFEDIKKLLAVLNRLVDKGNTVIVIEHNLDVIKTADYIIDLGPEGGDAGGLVIAEGSPADIIKNKASFTGKFLKTII